LSLACLGLFGRYLSDTLSGVRAVRAEDAIAAKVPLTNRLINHHLLADLLRRKADILEGPVQFVPLSPDRVRRTTVSDGLKALGIFASGRLRDPMPGRQNANGRGDLFANERQGEAGLQ
jgi:hypothetical protein